MKRIVILMIALLAAMCLWSQQKQVTLSGYVSDAASGEKLISANIYDPVSLTGTVSNTYGFYSLTLPSGQYNLVFSYVGYATQSIFVDLSVGKVLNVNLVESKALDEVTVTAGALVNKREESQMSKEVITMEMVNSLPAFMGEADIIKTLQLLPGVQSGSEASTGLYVRGGGPDQNLILLDGVPVYNASHLFGFFSVFNTDAIKNVTLYKGGFPARFGGRLSSVLDIRMKEGNEKEYHGGVQIGLIASKFFVEGPIVKDKTAFSISGRRTYIDVLTRPLMTEDMGTTGYYFYDFNAKVNHKFSARNRLYLSAYSGRDKAYSQYERSDMYSDYSSVHSSEDNLYWGNLTTAARWNSILTNKLFCNTTLTYSKYSFNVSSENSTFRNGVRSDYFSYLYTSGIDDVGVKVEFDWYPNHLHDIKYGFAYIYHTFKPGVETFELDMLNEENLNRTIGGKETYCNEMNVFAEDDVVLTDRIRANVGLHLSGFDVENTFYWSLEPRLSLRYWASDKITIKGAYSKMQQYLHLLSNSSIGLPTDLWVPVTAKIKPQISHQLAASLVYTPVKTYTFSVETFYKKMDNLIEYKDGASFFGTSTGWENKVLMGEGRSYGVELLARKELGKTTGWIGYTWSKSERLFDEINEAEWFPSHYDRRHDVSIVLSKKVSERFDYGLTWVFGTGNAITLPTNEISTLSDSFYGGSSAPYFEGRNNYRMPNYHRMDVGINFHKVKPHGVRTWNMSVYNLYNRQNPFYLYVGSLKDGQKTLNQISLFPIMPSVSYSFKF